MARVKHTLQNGVVHLRQQNSGKLAAIDVSLYEYINEEDKPSDEYVFRNGGSSTFNFSASGNTETSTITSQYGHEGSWSNVPFSCTEKPEWVTVNTTATSISVRADENTETSIRAGSVVLTQDTLNKKITIAVSQTAAESVGPGPSQDEYVFEAQNITFTFTAEDGSDSLSSGLSTDSTTVTSTKNGGWIDFTIDGGTGLGSGKQFMNWLVVTSEHTGGTTATLHIGVKKNETDKLRSQSFTLTQNESGNTINITVNQAAGVVEPEPDVYVFEASNQYIHGGSGEYAETIDITSTKNDEHVGWFTINEPDNWVNPEIRSDQIYIEFIDNHAEDEDTKARDTKMNLRQRESNKEIALSFHQEGEKADHSGGEAVYVFTISENNISVLPAELIKSVDVTSTKNGEFIAWTVEGGAPFLETPGKIFNDWLIVTPTADSAHMEQNLLLTSAENNTGEERSASFTLRQDGSGNTLEVSVTQQAKKQPEITYNYFFNFNQGESGTQNVDWNYTSDYTITIDSYRKQNGVSDEYAMEKVNFSVESKPDWVNASVDMSANNNRTGKLTFSASSANENSDKRQGDIVLKQENSENTLTVTVIQAGKPAGPDLSDLEFTGSGGISYKGGTGTLTITNSKNSPWTLSVDADNAHWQLEKTSGNGDGTVKVTVPANDKSQVLTGHFTLKCGEGGGIVIRSASLTQRGDTVEFNWKAGGTIWTQNLSSDGSPNGGSGEITNTLYSRHGNAIDGWESCDVKDRGPEGVITGLPAELGVGATCEVRCEVVSGNGADEYTVTLLPHLSGLEQWKGNTDGSESVNYTITIENVKGAQATIGGIITPAGGK